MTALDLEARLPRVFEPYTTLVECGDEHCYCHEDEAALHEEPTDQGEWIEQDEACCRVLVVMVGDDRKHEAIIAAGW